MSDRPPSCGCQRCCAGQNPRVDPFEGNARQTATTGAVIFVLFAVDGLSTLRIDRRLTLRVFVGIVLVPITLLKMGSTVWKFSNYYSGDPAYREKGP